MIDEIIAGSGNERLPPECRQIEARTVQRYPALARQTSSGDVVQLLMSACRRLGAATRGVRALELGCFAGFATAALASAVGDGGRVLSIERNDEHAAFARANIDALAPPQAAGRVEIVHADALAWLDAQQALQPFDLVYVDANKRAYASYLDVLLRRRLLRPPAVVVCDNMLFRGYIGADAPPPPKYRKIVDAIQAFRDQLAAHSRLHTTFLSISDGVSVSLYDTNSTD